MTSLPPFSVGRVIALIVLVFALLAIFVPTTLPHVELVLIAALALAVVL